MAKDTVKVRIGFRSGNEVIVDVESLHIYKENGKEVTEISWVKGPRLIFMKLDEIEYILEVK